MLKFLRKLRMGRSPNRYTLLSIILIVGMAFLGKMAAPAKSADFPETVFYNSSKYVYSETVDSMLRYFTGTKNTTYDGWTLLISKKDRGENPPKAVYIRSGNKKYRKYLLEEQ